MPFPTDLRYFRAHEFSDPDSMDPFLLIMLDAVRDLARVPIIITSSNRSNPGDETSAHFTGHAVDVSDNKHGLPVSSRWRYLVLKSALAMGLNRIGVYDRHIHIDTSTTHDQDVIWYGSSQ